MHHWHREHFSTHQFYADVLRDFAKKFPAEELDLLESGRDRHGYDCVLIRPGPSFPLTRYVQLKSTETDIADLTSVHGQMLLSEYREIARIQVSPEGECRYSFLSDFGRTAWLALAISCEGLKQDSTEREPETIVALKNLGKLTTNFTPPTTFSEVQKTWANVATSTWHPLDDKLRPDRKKLWASVLRPLALAYKKTFPKWRGRHTVNSRWMREVSRDDLITYLFR
jgi:hypothetical protein